MVNTKFKKTEKKKNQLLFFFFHKKFLKIFHKSMLLKYLLTFPIIFFIGIAQKTNIGDLHALSGWDMSHHNTIVGDKLS